MGQLVRDACEALYGTVSTEDRLAAVERLGELELPVGTPEEMETESVPRPEELLS